MKTVGLTIGLTAALWLSLPLLHAESSADSPASSASDNVITILRDSLVPRDFHEAASFSPCQIGLALSGGGARGIAHIGVLRAFEEAGLNISCIAGTSMGAIIGGLYASGYSASEIAEIVRTTDFAALFSDAPSRKSTLFTRRAEWDRYLFSIRFDGLKPYWPRALADGQKLTSLLTDLTITANYACGGDFDHLPIPFRAVATDIGTGERVALRRGSLAAAMRASMAFPLAFTAIEQDGRHLMDGGMVDPIPVDVCREMGADYVIACNTSSPLLPVGQISDPVEIANQVTTIMTQDALAEQLQNADLVLTPPLGEFASFSFGMHDTLEAIGYNAGREAVNEIVRALDGDDPHDFLYQGATAARDDSLLQGIVNNLPLIPGRRYSQWAMQKGLLFADREMRFHTLTSQIVPTDSGIALLLDGSPNRPDHEIIYRIEGINDSDTAAMARLLPMPTGAFLSLSVVKCSADSMVASLHRRGHDLASLRAIVYDHEAGIVRIIIDQGLLRAIDVYGNERTRSWYVRANFSLRKGEPFSAKKADDGLANVFGTGFFEQVGIDVEPDPAGARLNILVKEEKFTQLRVGGHWDDEYQAEMIAELLDDNVFGAGIQIASFAQISSRRHKYELSVKADRLSRTLLTARARGYFSRLMRRLFNPDGSPNDFRTEDRLGFSIEAGQQIARLGTIYSEYRIEGITTRLEAFDFEEDGILSIFAIKSNVETIDKYPFPNRGHRQNLAIEFSSNWLGSSFDEFTKAYGGIEIYWKIGNYLNLRPKITAGVSTADLPDVEKYFIGGLYNFSGYRTDQLAGDKYLMTSSQLRLKLPYRLYLIGNYDYGNVFNDYEDIRITDFLHGWGAALAIDTPIGPVDFGYGNAQHLPYRLYLNIGLRF